MDHIFLYGPPGSGKSTVGSELAQALGLPFVGLDSEIEKSTGRTIPQIMEEQGEYAFRDLETETLKRLARESPHVIALGGGALLREENRQFAERHGKVLFLEAGISTLTERLSNDGKQRPLLAGDLRRKLEELLARRDEHYSSFTARVSVDSRSPQKIAWEIQKQLGRFHVHGMGAAYDVVVQAKMVDDLGNTLKAGNLGGDIALVSDSNVAPFYAERALRSLWQAGYSANPVVIPAGEECKTPETVSSLWSAFLEQGLDRTSIVIALGGGVVGDLAGFAASVFMRGVVWVSVPTTLLSMVDASLGGKTGFNLPEGKNLIGSFHPPRLVLADLEVLATLPETEFRAGLAEVIKHSVIADPELYDLCSKGIKFVKENIAAIVSKAMAVKVKIIQEDPFEKNLRSALNLGHTVGHALELVSGFHLRHGEAVSIGMVAEAKLAECLAIADNGLSEALAESLAALGLPVCIPDNLPRQELIRAMRVDKKKAAGVVRFALPVRIGEVKVGVPVEDLEMIFKEDI